MNLNLYDNSDGTVYRERENRFRAHSSESNNVSDNNGSLPPFPSNAPLAMAFVRYQQWGDVMTAEEALNCGTLFSDLVMPFEEPAPSANTEKISGGMKR